MPHTKGPWKLEKAHDDYILLHKNIWFMNLIGRWYPSEEERLEHEANARLIASAPGLLEALEEIYAEYKDDYHDNTGGMELVRMAIRKAKA